MAVASRVVPPLHQFSFLLTAVFAAAVLVAFWPSYFSRLSAQPSFHPHAHGVTMSLWVGLLVTQAWLMRSGRRAAHRSAGQLVYVLAPALVLATIGFLHFRVRGAEALGDTGLYFMALVLNALAAFLVLLGLALWYRKRPAVHARFMIATVFPLFTPVTDRIIGGHLPSIVQIVPRIGGTPVVPVAGFLLADAILVALALWDWKANRRLEFAAALGVLLAYHASVLTFYQLGFWQAFCAWFVRLPLS